MKTWRTQGFFPRLLALLLLATGSGNLPFFIISLNVSYFQLELKKSDRSYPKGKAQNKAVGNRGKGKEKEIIIF
jgi:hypothetical protein